MNRFYKVKCIWVLSKEKPTWCHLFYYYLFSAQHVSDVNTSIFRSLRLILGYFMGCIWFGVCWRSVSANTHRTRYNPWNKQELVASSWRWTYWRPKHVEHWINNNKTSGIKLVSLYWTIKMMHGPINIRFKCIYSDCFCLTAVCIYGTESHSRCAYKIITLKSGGVHTEWSMLGNCNK